MNIEHAAGRHTQTFHTYHILSSSEAKRSYYADHILYFPSINI